MPLHDYHRLKADREFARQVAPLHELIRALDCGPCRVHKIEPINLTELRLIVSCSPSNDVFELTTTAKILTEEL